MQMRVGRRAEIRVQRVGKLEVGVEDRRRAQRSLGSEAVVVAVG